MNAYLVSLPEFVFLSSVAFPLTLSVFIFAVSKKKAVFFE